ncbi:hypothetical protein [Citrobacter freundii]|uniref:hypothetical protein n=1 Tax=Citrobacter freundii TaxID=546 RepID=UPI00388FF514
MSLSRPLYYTKSFNLHRGGKRSLSIDNYVTGVSQLQPQNQICIAAANEENGIELGAQPSWLKDEV